MTSERKRPSSSQGKPNRRYVLPISVVAVAVLVSGFALLSGGHLPGMNSVRPRASSFGGDAGHGRSLADAHCKACHGLDGNSSNAEIPKLAGQKAAYLASQLLAFRSGARPQQVMSATVASLSDSDITDLAKYYSKQSPKPDQPGDADLAARGQHIYYTNGSTMSGCAGCHDPSSGGMAAMMGGSNAPWLSGQHAAYLLAQMNAFASGQRANSIMDPIAASLSEEDRRALADYLSSRR